jgi:molybdopterin converting factor small subunit
MKLLLTLVSIVVIPVLFFAAYRSFVFQKEKRNIRKRRFDRLKDLIMRLEKKKPVRAAEIEKYAADRLTREPVYRLLKKFDKAGLFPAVFLSIEKGAESSLANWLEFPTELNAAPDEMEHLQRVDIDVFGEKGYYHVYQFRVNEPHKAAKKGWMIGAAGPYFEDSKPYDVPKGTFSRLNKRGDITLEEEVKWIQQHLKPRKNA